MEHLIQVQVKVLTYGGVPIEHDSLHDVIRYMHKPHIVNETDTIERLVDHAKIMKDVNGVPFVSETYLANLSECELTPCFLINSETFDSIRDGFINIEDLENEINMLCTS